MGQKLVAAQGKNYVGKYTRTKWIEGPNDWGNIVLDPQLRYLAKINAIGLYIWKISPGFVSGDLVYDNVKKYEYEVERGLAAATRDGLAFVAAYPHPQTNEPTFRLLLWEADSGRIKELQRRDEYLAHIFTNPDGTKLIRLIARMENEFFENGTYHPPKVGEAGYEIRDLDTGKIQFIDLLHGEKLNTAFAVGMDSSNNIYDVVQSTNEPRDIARSDLFLRFLQAGGEKRIALSRQNEPLLTNWKKVGLPQKPLPLLLNDGLTVAAFVKNETSNGSYSIQYFREGKLVKTVNDPVPNGAGEARLAITSDGKDVVTQVTSGKKIGLVKVWNIETKKDSEITTIQPITHIFPWVQGKYAPVWTSTDDHTCEAGILEITR